MNRLLKFPRPNRAAGSAGYILGRPSRDIEAAGDQRNDDIDDYDSISVVAGHSTTPTTYGAIDNDYFNDDCNNDSDSIDRVKINKRRTANTLSIHNKTINTASSSSTSKMTTRYRFRDLLLGDFSFNDDGERYVCV